MLRRSASDGNNTTGSFLSGLAPASSGLTSPGSGAGSGGAAPVGAMSYRAIASQNRRLHNSFSMSPAALGTKLRPAAPPRKKSLPPQLRRRGEEWLSVAACASVHQVPAALRSMGHAFHASPSGLNDGLVVETICASKLCSVETLEQIDRDLPRTYPDVDYFSNTDIRDALGRVLRAVAIEYPEVGYVQGMNFIGANLLLHTGSSEDRALSLFRLLMENPRYRLCHVFEPGLTNLRRLSDVLESLFRSRWPALHAHLDQVGLEPLFYSQNWIMTLYSYMMPFEVLAQVWDRFFARGWPVLFQVALALLGEHAEALQRADFEAAAQILRRAGEEPRPDLCARADAVRLTAAELALIQRAVAMEPFELPQAPPVPDLVEQSGASLRRLSLGSDAGTDFTLLDDDRSLGSPFPPDAVFVSAETLAFGGPPQPGSGAPV
mmetsp:Transcript_9179/g.29245  ORF Transcript_9179/g.29245 Transcript_9179/m.29245 type:complete len:435 (-) Transcript_9179:32-1336(-)